MPNNYKQQIMPANRCPSECGPLTDDQIKAILVAADTEWRGISLTSLSTGARLLDIVNLRWIHLDINTKEIRFAIPGSSRSNVVPMTSELHEYFISLPGPAHLESPVFPSCFKVAPGRRGVLTKRFLSFQRRANLKPISFRALRITFITTLKNGRMPESLVAEIIGHSSSDWRVMPHSKSMKQEAIASLPRRIH